MSLNPYLSTEWVGLVFEDMKQCTFSIRKVTKGGLVGCVAFGDAMGGGRVGGGGVNTTNPNFHICVQDHRF